MLERIDFLITNPNHHWQMICPVIRRLKQTSEAEIRVLSLCAFRRMATPSSAIEAEGVECLELPGFTNLGLKPSSGSKELGSANSWKRRLVQWTIWYFYLRPAWRRTLLRNRPKCVFLLNDFAYPSNYLTAELNRLAIPFYLLQEGIRFPLPNEADTPGFGTMGARKIMTWGENSKAYFQSIVNLSKSTVVKVGCPRYDEILRQDFTEDEKKMTERYGEKDYRLGLFSNPIDDQGFCSTFEKMELIRRFLTKSLPNIKKRKGVIWIKLHPRESLSDFNQLIEEEGWSEDVQLVEGNIFPILKMVNVAVVMASTVGLEALLMGTPLGILSIPDYGFVFDYVSGQGGIGLDLEADDFNDKLEAILSQESISLAAADYLERNIAYIGSSAELVAALLEQEISEK